MKMQTKNRRGWLQIVEVTIAALLVFYALNSLYASFKYTQSTVDESIRLRKMAEDTLIALDNMPAGETTVLRDKLNKRDNAALFEETGRFIKYPLYYSYEIEYQNETYVSRKAPKKLSASASYLIFDYYEGMPARYSVKLFVWSAA